MRWRGDPSLEPGQTFLLHGWFRDPGFALPMDIGFSNALVFTLWP